MPPQVAPIARASCTASLPFLPKTGWSMKVRSTSSSPTREAIATPFHWLSPKCATS